MTDSDLLTALADLLDRADPVPSRVRSAAVAAGTFLGAAWDWLDLVSADTVAVRGDAVVWRSAAGTIEVADQVRGLLVIPVSRVEVHSAHGVLEVRVAEDGSFSTGPLPGRKRLILHRDGDVPLVTGWFA